MLLELVSEVRYYTLVLNAKTTEIFLQKANRSSFRGRFDKTFTSIEVKFRPYRFMNVFAKLNGNGSQVKARSETTTYTVHVHA